MADHRNTNLFMVTLARLADGEEVTFWVSGKSEDIAADKAKRVIGEACSVVDIVPCCGSPAQKSKAA